MYNHHTLHVTEGVQSTVLLYVYIMVLLGITHIIQEDRQHSTNQAQVILGPCRCVYLA